MNEENVKYIKKEWLSHDNQSSLLTLNLIPWKTRCKYKHLCVIKHTLWLLKSNVLHNLTNKWSNTTVLNRFKPTTILYSIVSQWSFPLCLHCCSDYVSSPRQQFTFTFSSRYLSTSSSYSTWSTSPFKYSPSGW